MLIKKYEQRLEDFADMDDIPKTLSDRIYESACKADQMDLIDYCDGDFYYKISFSYDQYPWLDELKEMLPDDVVDRDMFAIYYSQ